MTNSWKCDPSSEFTAEALLCKIAGVCDGAHTLDNQGFSGADVQIGHSMAQQAANGKAWSEKQAVYALKMITKYSRQIGGKEFVRQWMTNPVFRQMPFSKNVDSANKNDRLLRSKDKLAVFSFGYNTELVTAMKSIRGVHKGENFWNNWDPITKTWVVPVNATSIYLIMKVAEKFNFDIEQRFHDYISKLEDSVQEGKMMLAMIDQNVTVADDSIIVAVDDPAILEEFKNALSANQ